MSTLKPIKTTIVVNMLSFCRKGFKVKILTICLLDDGILFQVWHIKQVNICFIPVFCFCKLNVFETIGKIENNWKNAAIIV